MKTLLKALMFTLAIGTAHAAQLEDVSLLDLKSGKGSFIVKLQVKGAKPDSYFSVEIVKEDEKALEKMALVLKKMKLKGAFKLNLEIQSFSANPPGSYYKSPSVTFIGSSEGESLIQP